MRGFLLFVRIPSRLDVSFFLFSFDGLVVSDIGTGEIIHDFLFFPSGCAVGHRTHL